MTNPTPEVELIARLRDDDTDPVMLRQAADLIEAQAAELEAEVSKLRGAISWIEPPFVDATTSHDELKKRVGFCVADAKRAALGEQP